MLAVFILGLFFAVLLWWRYRFAVAALGFGACIVAGLAGAFAVGGLWRAAGGGRPDVRTALTLLVAALGQIAVYVAIDGRAVPGPRNPTFAVPVALAACATALVAWSVLG